MTPRALLLLFLLSCAGSTEPAATPEPPAPEQPAPEQPAPEPPAPEQPASTENPCDKLESQVFDVTDSDARTDLSDAQKEQAKREQAERRRVLFECFERAMKEKQELDQPAR